MISSRWWNCGLWVLYRSLVSINTISNISTVHSIIFRWTTSTSCTESFCFLHFLRSRVWIPASPVVIIMIILVWYNHSLYSHLFQWKVSGVSVMNLINHRLHLDVVPFFDPPASPTPFMSLHLFIFTWLIHPSICSHTEIHLMKFHWHFMLTYSDYCSTTLWHRWAFDSPTWPSYKAGLPAKSGRTHSGTGELEWVWPYCAAPASPFKPYPSASPAILPPHRALLLSPFPHAVKPIKSTKLSRSDGRVQNSIWCALFVDCVRLVAEGTRLGAYHAELEWSPHLSTKHPAALPNNEKWKILQLV